MPRVGIKPFDKLKGYQVIARFDVEKKRDLIQHTGKHRANCSTFNGNVECILEMPIQKRVRKL